mgnify:CR=1 FL=1
MSEVPTTTIDDLVHQRHRLGILTITAQVEEVEFLYLRDALDLTAGNLNRHLAVLEDAELIGIRKEIAGKRPRTWVRLTPSGKKALAAEMSALEELVRQHRVALGGSPAATATS